MSQVVTQEFRLDCAQCNYSIKCKSGKSRDMLGRLHRKKCKGGGRTAEKQTRINNGLKMCAESIELQEGEDIIMDDFKCRLLTTLNVKVK
jgi:hypothetical protein